LIFHLFTSTPFWVPRMQLVLASVDGVWEVNEQDWSCHISRNVDLNIRVHTGLHAALDLLFIRNSAHPYLYTGSYETIRWFTDHGDH
jgi:hypothetical protein